MRNTAPLSPWAREVARATGYDRDGRAVLVVRSQHFGEVDPGFGLGRIVLHRPLAHKPEHTDVITYAGEGAAERIRQDWKRLRDDLGDSRVRHAGGNHRPLNTYDQVIPALAARGMTAHWDVEGPGQIYLRIELELDSWISLSAWDTDFLPEDPAQLTGWQAQYSDLTGNPTDRHVYEERTPDLDQLADGLAAFLRRREHFISEELAAVLEDRLYPAAVNVDAHEERDGHWSIDISSAAQPFGSTYLTVASHPHPEQGMTTQGHRMTGWRVTAHHPGRKSRIIYDASDALDTAAVCRAIEDHLLDH
jgi:hypothetical protein